MAPLGLLFPRGNELRGISVRRRCFLWLLRNGVLLLSRLTGDIGPVRC